MGIPRIRSVVGAVAISSTLALVLGSCSTPQPAASGSSAAVHDIVFWTQETTPDRMTKQVATAAKFTAKTGIKVDVVALAAADQNQALVTGSASGKVPDVILENPDQTAAWDAQGLLDTAAAGAVIDKLGKKTFSANALRFVTFKDGTAAVPSDGWTHLIVYRTDLFKKAGLKAPTSLAEVAADATALKGGRVSGMAFGTQPGTPSSTEALESILHSAGCSLITDGKVTIDSDNCVKGLGLFKQLADSSVAGQFDVTSARSAYLAGNAAMLLFSPYILDQLSGLDPANPVTCPECATNPQFLAENSGFVTVVDPSAPAQYGTTLNYGIPTGAHSQEAKQFVEYLLTDGYLEALGVATEGRVPLRAGTADNPTEYLDGWGKLPFGIKGNTKSIADVYGVDVVKSLSDGVNALSRWGYGTPDAALAATAFSQNLLSAQLEQLYAGTSPETVTKSMAASVTALQKDLG